MQAESPSDVRPTIGVPCDDGLLQCPDCPRGFTTKVGASIHRRRVHPEAYHLASMPQPRVKARWDHEEKVLLAMAELALESNGDVVKNNELAEKNAGRTAQAIKKVRQRAD